MFHIFSNLFSFPISNSRAFPVAFFPLVLSPGPRSGFLHLHRYSYYVASYALFLHPWKQINCCLFYSFLGQHRTILALRLKHRSGICRTSLAVSALRIMRYCLSSTTPIENVRKTKMLRKGEQCSPTDVCHVYDINVRCYVKAAGAQCAPLCSQQNF